MNAKGSSSHKVLADSTLAWTWQSPSFLLEQPHVSAVLPLLILQHTINKEEVYPNTANSTPLPSSEGVWGPRLVVKAANLMCKQQLLPLEAVAY